MKLAEFVTISRVDSIPGADRIELATVQGWQSVIRKGEYKAGDQVIFVPIDTVIQPAEWNKFLWDKNDPTKPIRVRTVRLRGAVSQGIIFPKSLVSAQEIWDHMDDPSENVSIAGILGITKYERPVPANLAGQVAGDFPSHLISKTDEDNLKSNIAALDELKQCAYVSATIKVDGSSTTYIKEHDGTFRVCSRNLELCDTESNAMWQQAHKHDLPSIMRTSTSIQAEIAGPGIQGNPMGLKEVQLFIFNYKDLNSKKYINLHWSDLTEDDLYLKKLQLVPHVKDFAKEEFAEETIETLQQLANEQLYPNGKPAEGIVLRGYDEHGESVYSQTLGKMLSVKIINQNFID